MYYSNLSSMECFELGLRYGIMPLYTQQVDDGQLLYSVMNNAAAMDNSSLPKGQMLESDRLFHLPDLGGISPDKLPDLDAILLAMCGRYSSKPIDKVYSIAFLFQRHGYLGLERNVIVPIYDPSTTASVAWGRLISSIASIDMADFFVYYPLTSQGETPKHVRQTPTVQLLRLFPHPSRHHWFPSWTQVQQYPNISVRDDDPALITGGTNYSLHIKSGRIYHGCSLELVPRFQPLTSGEKSIYRCTMNGNEDAWLMATVPGIELDIDSGSKYVLVDISPDRSLWPMEDQKCKETDKGHKHQPVWLESVILVCKEVDKLPTKHSSGIIRYRLRRVTTLEWDCKLVWPTYDLGGKEHSFRGGWPDQPLSLRPGCWLPFEPSLVHIKSIVCSAIGGPHPRKGLPSTPDVFCDPAAVAGLSGQIRWHEEWHKGWPAYEVYLV